MAENGVNTSTVISTDEEIEQWKQCYCSVESIERELIKQMNKHYDCVGVSQQKFTKVLASLAMMKEDPRVFIEQHGILYQWQWQYTKDMNKDGEACGAYNHLLENEKNLDVDDACLMPDGWRWVLQLKAGDRWCDWVYIKTSNRLDDQLGLFAARDFAKGSVIGFFIGQPYFRNEDDTYLSRTRENSFPLRVRIMNGSWQTVQLLRAGSFPGIPLYLGMHYLNSACQYFKFGSKEFEDAKKNQNCYINDDGSVQALRKIAKNVELLAGYSDAERKATICNDAKNENCVMNDPVDYKWLSGTNIRNKRKCTANDKQK